MLKSFKYAFRGIFRLVKNENNAQFHFIFTILVLVIGFFFKISSFEWLIISVFIGMVWAAEAFNTAIEKLCDFIKPDFNSKIGEIKDLAASGVLFVAIAAGIAAAIIFLPKIIALF